MKKGKVNYMYPIAFALTILVWAIILRVDNKVDNKAFSFLLLTAIGGAFLWAKINETGKVGIGSLLWEAKREMRAEKTSLLQEIDDQVTIHKTTIAELIKKAEKQRKLTELWIDGSFVVHQRDYDKAIYIFKKIYDLDGSKLAREIYAETLFEKARNSKQENNYEELLADAKKEYMKMEEKFKDADYALFLARISSLQDDEPECRKWLEYGSEHKALPKKEDLNRNISTDLSKYDEKDWMKSIGWGE